MNVTFDFVSDPVPIDKSDDIENWREKQLVYILLIEILSIYLAFAGYMMLTQSKNYVGSTRRRSAINEEDSTFHNLDTKNGLPKASSFCYDDPECGPSAWPGICATGKEQSPISIQTHPPMIMSLTDRRESFHLNSKYKRSVFHRYYAQNNGHTVQFELSPNPDALKSELSISGGGLKDTYNFAQLHFHWGEVNDDGSEHALDGRRFPMEMHAVHYRKKYGTFKEAMEAEDDRQALAVMAVFIHIQPEENVALRPIVDAMAKLSEPGNVTQFDMDLNIAALYPNKAKAEYGQYLGSLTTPSCDEIVIWSVFLDSIGMSEYQMGAFRHMRSGDGASDFNFRPIQPLNGRQLIFYRPSLFSALI